MLVCCEHGEEPSDLTEGRIFLDYLRDSAHSSYLIIIENYFCVWCS